MAPTFALPKPRTTQTLPSQLSARDDVTDGLAQRPEDEDRRAPSQTPQW